MLKKIVYSTAIALGTSSTVTVLDFSAKSYLAAQKALVRSWDDLTEYSLTRFAEANGLEKKKPVYTSRAEIVLAAAKKYNIDEALILAVMRVESRNKASAYSIKGAIGLMQIMPENAHIVGVKDNPGLLYDEEKNIFAGAAILAENLKTYGSLEKALIVYNAGPRGLKKLPKETADYVNDVLTQYQILASAIG